MIYQATKEYIKENLGNKKVSLRAVSKIVGISRSGYTSWQKRKKSKQEKHKENMKKLIMDIYHESREIYGAPKITKKLREQGHKIGGKTVSNYMKELGIKACYIKPWTKTTISKDFTSNLKNVLKREFNPEKPDEAWCTDITYIWTYEEGFVYLTSVMDLYSRKIISWVLTKDMRSESVLKAIRIAKERRNVTKPLILHSDYTEKNIIPKFLNRSYKYNG